MSTSSRGGTESRDTLGLLCVLSMALHNSPRNVSTVLQNGVNVQFVRCHSHCKSKYDTQFFLQLLELISQSSADTLLQGAAAFLLGILYEFNDDSKENMTRAKLLPIITGRIGIDVYVNRINRLRDSDWMKGSGGLEVNRK